MKIAAGYVRTSSYGNPESSIPNQINEITNYCKKNNIVLLTVLIDEKKSGTKTDGREKYLQLKNLIMNRSIDMVVVAYSDRLARDAFEFVLALQEMQKHKIEFISISENIKVSNMSPQEIVWMGIQNEMENKARSKRMQDARNIGIREGKCPFTVPPIGYKLDENKRLIIDESYSQTVKTIFKMYLNKTPLAEIVNYLNDNNIKTRKGNKWVHSHVISVLSSRTFTGYMYARDNKKRLSPVSHEAYITEEVHEQVTVMLKSRTRKVINTYFYLASKGILKCEKCKTNMIINNRLYVCKKGFKCQKICPIKIEQLIPDFLRTIIESKVSDNEIEIERKKAMLFELKSRTEKRYAKATITKARYDTKLEEINMELNLLYKSLANNSEHFEILDHLKNKNLIEIKKYLLKKNLSFVYSEKENIIKQI
jgi:site-specific DNA recombinase